MTIRRKLHTAFLLILAIIIFIVGIFFYAIYNLNTIHIVQIQTYEEIRTVYQKEGEKTILSELQQRLKESEEQRNILIRQIQIELVALLIIAFLLSFYISSKLIKEIQQMLSKLNSGVLQLLRNELTFIKVDIGKNNELSELTSNLNTVLEKKQNTIEAREELLRNISHELKTPITKGKFLIEKLKNGGNSSLVVEDINRVFYDIEQLTSKLLQREKLNFAVLKPMEFHVTSLILDSLSKLSLDDESKVVIDIKKDIKIFGDKDYLVIAVKNLIDNALKYTQHYPIIIQAEEERLQIKNKGKKLTHDIIYYLEPFTREPNQQSGHGLGLNIVYKILLKHQFELEYDYQNGYNIFAIHFKK